MGIADALLPEFDHEMTVTRKLLERVPEGQFGWKPHEKSMTLGQLAQHVATIPRWGASRCRNTSSTWRATRRPRRQPPALSCWRSSTVTSVTPARRWSAKVMER